MLGGKDNYEADRAAADATIKVNLDLVPSAHLNRAFLGRAIRYLAGEAGIRQFPDIGTGIPTAGNTHRSIMWSAVGRKTWRLKTSREAALSPMTAAAAANTLPPGSQAAEEPVRSRAGCQNRAHSLRNAVFQIRR